MQRTKKTLEVTTRSRRRELIRRLCLAACVAVAGSATPTALAQTPTDARETVQPVSATPATDADDAPDAVSAQRREPSALSRARVAPSGTQALLRRLAADLRLDAGQQQRILPILLAQREQMQHLQHDTALLPAERQRRILALGDRTADQIRAQLTDVQRAQYIKPRAARTVSSPASMPAATTGKEVKP